MSSNPTRLITPEHLLLEYLLLTREQISYNTTIVQHITNTTQNSTNTIRSLLQRYLEIQNRENSNVQNQSNRRQPINYRSPFRENRRTNYSVETNTPLSTNVHTINRTHRQSPLSSYTSRRRRVRTPNPYRQRISQILENTLYQPYNRQPATQIDISRNISNHIWRDINNTEEIMCPITQEHFQSTDSVSRIDACGHLFHEQALTTYLREFDHRCPVCRYNIRTTYPSENDYTNSTTNTIPAAEPYPTDNIPSFQDLSNNPPRALTRTDSNVLDISFNFPNLANLGFSNSTSLPSNITSTQPLEFNFNQNNFDTAINQLSNAMLSSLTTAINNPDNSGNSIAAEYSLFIPQPITQDESTSTQDDYT